MKFFVALIFIAVVESARLPQKVLEETNNRQKESIPDSVTDVSEIPVGEFQLLTESDLSSSGTVSVAEETSEGIVTGTGFELEQRRRPWSRPNSFGRPPFYGSSPYLMRPPFNHQFLQSPYPSFYSHQPIIHSFYPVVHSPLIWPGHSFIWPTYPEMSTFPESTTSTEAATSSDPITSEKPVELTAEQPASEVPEDLTTEQASTQPASETAQLTTQSELETSEPNLADLIGNIFQLPLFGNFVQLADNFVQKPLSANFALNVGRQ